jgi:predicted RNA-binding Zn-ribbon protein involved in translation (DUF1610 family)
MSKITFRADDDLISELEELDASKSEIMREALRIYLDSDNRGSLDNDSDSSRSHGKITFDQLVYEHIDDLVTERVNRFAQSKPQDINVNITLDDERRTHQNSESSSSSEDHKTQTAVSDSATEEREQCTQCGELLSDAHVYCPNCGEKANHRVFCECGDEIRSDWSFCPSCGRRTPAADVLDQS